MSKLIAAVAALLLSIVALAAPAAAADGPVRVTSATYHSYTQARLSPCGTGYADPSQNAYVAPRPPQSVLDAVKHDQADPRDWYNTYKGFRNTTPGGHLTGNGLPTVVWRADRYDLRDLYIPYLDTTVKVRHTEYRFHAWVPGFAGKPCSVWTEIEYVR